MTYEHSQPPAWQQTEFPWMSSAEGSPARISALQEQERGLQASGRAYGAITPDLLARYDPVSLSWRTSQHSFFGGLETFSETWPRSGMMRSGIAYQLQPLVLSTKETGSGSLPTLTRCGNYNRKGASKTSGDGLATILKRLPTLTHHDFRGGCKPERTARMQEQSARGCDLPSELRRQYPETTGIINPSWAEGFMGFPIGWTALVL